MHGSLTSILSGMGELVECRSTPDGSRLLLLGHGARVLGLFAPDSDENFYWTNPALSSVDPTDFFRGDGWHNSGGDRTWLAPEIDLFFPKFPDLSTYRVPGELDPGRYEIERSGSSVRVVNRFGLKLFWSCQTIQVEIAKSWSPALNPLRHEESWRRAPGVEYAGYTQKTSLGLLDIHGSDLGPIGVWNLVQMPHGGELVVPLHGETQPTIYFGSIPPDDIKVSSRSIHYRMDASGIQKIGIRAVAATGRAGYSYPTLKGWALVVRNVFANPAGEYVDVPWTSSGELGDRGYIFQACNVKNDLGCFSELEYHAPAIGRGTGRIEHEDISQVWAFRGPKESIQLIGQGLLSSDF